MIQWGSVFLINSNIFAEFFFSQYVKVANENEKCWPYNHHTPCDKTGHEKERNISIQTKPKQETRKRDRN